LETTVHTPDGLALWVETFGDPGAPAILLVMGAMNQGIFWPEDFCKNLSDSGFHVIRYDHRDTGRSSVVHGLRQAYTLVGLTRDAVAVLDGLGIARATVVGLSMGGFIGQMMALQYPDRVDRLVLLSTSADHRPYMAATLGLPTGLFRLPGPERVFLDQVARMRRHPPRTEAEWLASINEGWAVTYAGPRPYPRAQVEKATRLAFSRAADPKSAMRHALAVGASAHRLKKVQQIEVQTLVIHGRFDPCLPLAHGEYLASQIPHATLLVLDMGHTFMWSWDDEVLQAVRAFASGGPQGAPH
jgi:pimeloyl-ACP methyl ester carboxylesterase